MSNKLTPATLFLLLLASLVWGGAAIYFNLAADPFYPFALDGATWEKARGGLVATEIVPTGPVERAGLLPTDTLLLANGVSVTSEKTLQEVINQIPTGQRAIYTVRRGDGLVRLEVAIERDTFKLIQHWLMKLAGFLYIFLAILVFTKKPELKTTWLFLFLGLMLGFLLSIILVDESVLKNNPLKLFFDTLGDASFMLIPALALDFFRRLLFFPISSPRRELTLLTYLLPSLVFLLNFSVKIVKLQVPIIPPNWLWDISYGATWGVYLPWFIIEIVLRVKKKQLLINSRQAKWLLWGAGLPMAIVVSNLRHWIIGEWLTYLLLLPPPFVLAYLILKERLLDIGVVIKRSAIYTILSALLIATFVILVMATSQLFVLLTGEESNLAVFAAALITAVVFNLYRQKTQNYLDRKFFKDRHNYQRALLEFSKELARLENLDTLLTKISKQFAETLHLANCLPFIYNQKADAYGMISPYGLFDPPLLKVRYSASEFGLTTLLVKEKRPLEFYDLETNPLFTHLPVAEKVSLRKTDTALAVPLMAKEKLVGMLLLGNKKSGDYFNAEDIDFFATLSSSLAVAVENARLYKEELEKHEMEKELDVARRIQEKLLGRQLPKLPGIDLYAAYLPSRQVSGDMYSVIPVKNNQLALAIGDVSGKGIPASLLMASLQSSLQMLCLECFPPADIISRLNRLVCENTDPEDFVTFFYAVYDRDNRKLSYVNAGHNPPLYFPAKGEPKELSEGGLPLGIFSDRQYQADELSVQPGSPIVLYTDGVTEAGYEFEEQFGCQRLAKIVAQNRHLSAQEIGERILSGLHEFCGARELEDDVSLVILKTV